jgi:hypothetical protein
VTVISNEPSDTARLAGLNHASSPSGLNGASASLPAYRFACQNRALSVEPSNSSLPASVHPGPTPGTSRQ